MCVSVPGSLDKRKVAAEESVEERRAIHLLVHDATSTGYRRASPFPAKGDDEVASEPRSRGPQAAGKEMC